MEACRKGAKRAGEAVAQAASEAHADLHPLMVDMRTKGMTLQAIADDLNVQGQTTRRGKPWNAVQVARVLEHQYPRPGTTPRQGGKADACIRGLGKSY
jgi:hypothetical protein